jgi:ATPase subunit of ABC transporter with duplicated ATPase domains
MARLPALVTCSLFWRLPVVSLVPAPCAPPISHLLSLPRPPHPPTQSNPPPAEPEPIRYTGPLLQLRSVSYRYPGAPSAVLRGVTMDIAMGSRLALLGPNGAGKSTLLRLIAGTTKPTPPGDDLDGSGAPASPSVTKPAQPTVTKRAAAAARGLAVTAAALPTAQAAAAAAAGAAGSVERHANLEVGLFGQHCVEDLDVGSTALETIAGGRCALSVIGGWRELATAPIGRPTPDPANSAANRPTSTNQPTKPKPAAILPSMREQDARDFLGSFGLGGRLATQPLSTLSGGQKARAALCLVLLRRPHVLLLDEPTNHLDLDAAGRSVWGLVAACDGNLCSGIAGDSHPPSARNQHQPSAINNP